MELSTEYIFQWLSAYAYEPALVYSMVFLLMLGGSFGLPIPEEVAIISVGILAYMSGHPDIYPPPEGASGSINLYHAAIFTLLAVIISDLSVFTLGRKVGPKIKKSRYFARLMSERSLKKIEYWTQKYGMWAAGVFRFTPGLRFPGFWACGMYGLPSWKFLTADGLAAVLTVPTQIILVALYGESIINLIKDVKNLVILILAGMILFFAIKLIYRKRLLKVR